MRAASVKQHLSYTSRFRVKGEITTRINFSPNYSLTPSLRYPHINLCINRDVSIFDNSFPKKLLFRRTSYIRCSWSMRQKIIYKLTWRDNSRDPLYIQSDTERGLTLIYNAKDGVHTYIVVMQIDRAVASPILASVVAEKTSTP